LYWFILLIAHVPGHRFHESQDFAYFVHYIFLVPGIMLNTKHKWILAERVNYSTFTLHTWSTLCVNLKCCLWKVTFVQYMHRKDTWKNDNSIYHGRKDLSRRYLCIIL
jgi:hypothetical protein